MVLSEIPSPRQVPLIHVVEADDLHLEQQSEVVWFDVLRRLDYRPFQSLVAKYYEVLAQFNQQQVARRESPPGPPNPETRDDATQRLLFARATLAEGVPVLFTPPTPPTPEIRIDPAK